MNTLPDTIIVGHNDIIMGKLIVHNDLPLVFKGGFERTFAPPAIQTLSQNSCDRTKNYACIQKLMVSVIQLCTLNDLSP